MSGSVSTSMQRVVTSAILFLFAAQTFATWSGVIANEIWQLPPSATGSRWLVIHNLASAENDGVYHVEVLERAFGAEVWSVEHVADHMALSSSALRASIVKPLKRGAVYPESFNEAYSRWKKQKNQDNAPVCTTSVLECLK